MGLKMEGDYKNKTRNRKARSRKTQTNRKFAVQRPKLFVQAFFQIFIIVFSIFTVSLLAEPVEAALKCCEKTKIGDYCQYVDETNCDSGAKSTFTSCENTNFCQLGSCNVVDEGRCFDNVPRSLCVSKNGNFDVKPSSEIQQCQKGCCRLSNEFFFVTQTQCRLETQKYPNLVMQFDSGIETEAECINQQLSKEEGCCVQEGICKYTARGECGAAVARLGENRTEVGGFYKDIFCSNTKLACDCTPHHSKGCLPGKDDVYWLDSCGNPEDVAEDCDYASGTLCGAVDGELTCKNLNCAKTTSFETTEGSGGARANGESWCAYEGSVGQGTDLVGSRHYKASCIAGEEIIEPCKDFREDICVEAQNVVGFSEGRCRSNRWQDCNEQKDKKACQNTDLRDCMWAGDACVPYVPPGFRFWEGEGNDRCNQANDKEKFKDEESVPQGWVDMKADQCMAQGDCGDHFNIIGREGKGGFKSSHKEKSRSNFKNFKKGWGGIMGRLGLFVGLAGAGKLFQESVPFFGGLTYFTGVGGGNKFFSKNIAKDVVLKWDKAFAPKEYWDLIQSFDKSEPITLGGKTYTKVADAWLDSQGKEIGADALKQEIGKNFLPSGFTANIAKILNLAGWLFLVYNIIDLVRSLLTKDTTITATVTCNTWQAPRGGADCELCNNRQPFEKDGKPVFKCTEYACKSLGAACSLINEGTGNETCVNIAVNDANSPIISAWPEALIKGYKIVETLEKGFEGYRIEPEVEPFTPVIFGIKTNEPSQCKMSLEPGVDFDAMNFYFGDNIYTYTHSLVLSLPGNVTEPQVLELTNGGEYLMFARCADAGGNKNAKDYFIKFRVKKGPDLTPPEIISTSIINGAFAPHGAKETELSIYVNEPAECKWDYSDTSFDIMPNKFKCASSGLDMDINYLYECSGKLDKIEDDKINKYYFTCKDKAGNMMQESFEYSLIGTKELELAEAGPIGRVNNPVTLSVKTKNGALNGKAVCGYSENGFDGMIQFLETNSSTHNQKLILEDGNYLYYVKCVDDAGNIAQDIIEFTAFTDVDAPRIIRIYEDRTLAQRTLHLTMDENSICEYSHKSFGFGEGNRMPVDNTKEHEAIFGADAYFVICRDMFNNTSPGWVIYP